MLKPGIRRISRKRTLDTTLFQMFHLPRSPIVAGKNLIARIDIENGARNFREFCRLDYENRGVFITILFLSRTIE